MARFVKGQSGNPKDRPKTFITNFGVEARKHLELCIETLVEIARKGSNRDRLVAVDMLLNRASVNRSIWLCSPAASPICQPRSCSLSMRG
jgi:hypothetical protein